MVPRADIVAVHQEITLGELIMVFAGAGHSRLVVYNDTLDDPAGMVHIRDLVAFMAARAAIDPASVAVRTLPAADLDFAKIDLSMPLVAANIIRELLYAPPSMPALDLLAKMQATRIHLALIIDEYGGSDGLVSIEDLVELIVGDIADEHDEDEKAMVTRQNDGSFLAIGRASLDDVRAVIGDEFDVGGAAQEVDTLGAIWSCAPGTSRYAASWCRARRLRSGSARRRSAPGETCEDLSPQRPPSRSAARAGAGPSGGSASDAGRAKKRRGQIRTLSRCRETDGADSRYRAIVRLAALAHCIRRWRAVGASHGADQFLAGSVSDFSGPGLADRQRRQRQRPLARHDRRRNRRLVVRIRLFPGRTVLDRLCFSGRCADFRLAAAVCRDRTAGGTGTLFRPWRGAGAAALDARSYADPRSGGSADRDRMAARPPPHRLSVESLGYALTSPLALAQTASVIGIWGLTFIAVAAFASPATLTDDRSEPVALAAARARRCRTRRARRLWRWRLSATPTRFVDKVHLRIMQPNLQQDVRFNYAAKQQVIDRYLALSTAPGPQSLGVRDATHLIWPESAFPFFFTREPDALAQIAKLLHDGTVLITGAVRLAEPVNPDRSSRLQFDLRHRPRRLYRFAVRQSASRAVRRISAVPALA